MIPLATVVAEAAVLRLDEPEAACEDERDALGVSDEGAPGPVIEPRACEVVSGTVGDCFAEAPRSAGVVAVEMPGVLAADELTGCPEALWAAKAAPWVPVFSSSIPPTPTPASAIAMYSEANAF